VQINEVRSKGSCATTGNQMPPPTLDRRPTPDRAGEHRLLAEIEAALLVTLLGALVRSAHVHGVDFPVNDGGMFYVMTEDLLRAGFHLPLTTTYNHANIPFAYPPLPFYVAGLLGLLTGDLLAVFRLLPLAVSVLTIPAFYALSRAMLPSRFSATLATVAFALMPRSFNWEISGGGLTRGMGLLFAILALQFAYRMYTEQRWRYVALTALFSALTVLSHLEMAWFVAFSALLFLGFLGRRRSSVGHSLLVGAVVVALTAPWWFTVLHRHCAGPLLSAAQSGGHSLESWLYPFVVSFTDEPLHEVLGLLAVLGAVVSAIDRRWLLPAWFLCIYILDPRKAATNATLPEALLAAYAMAEVILPRLQGRDRTGVALSHASVAVLSALLVYSTFSALVAPLERSSPLHALTAGDRQALQWVRDYTPPESRFLVFAVDRNDVPSWARDRLSEWFPALTGRQSVATVQGFEWLGREALQHQIEAYRRVQLCAERGSQCLDAAAAQDGLTITHVYVPKPSASDWRFSDCCAAIRQDLLRSETYVPVYDGPAATVFARRSLN
jgi:hypothetical protein